jgi:hypothetical protein
MRAEDSIVATRRRESLGRAVQAINDLPKLRLPLRGWKRNRLPIFIISPKFERNVSQMLSNGQIKRPTDPRPHAHRPDRTRDRHEIFLRVADESGEEGVVRRRDSYESLLLNEIR